MRIINALSNNMKKRKYDTMSNINLAEGSGFKVVGNAND